MAELSDKTRIGWQSEQEQIAKPFGRARRWRVIYAEVPRPFFRSSCNCWFVQIGNDQIKLHRDEQELFRHYHELMGFWEIRRRQSSCA